MPQILPSDRTYITYEGSLTTPPCSEGIAWHVLTKPVDITLQQVWAHDASACTHSLRLGLQPP